MEEIIQVRVIDKHAILEGAPVIVCGNEGYFVEFSFDEEWQGMAAKTARFVYVRRGAVQYQDRVFTGTRVEVPVLTSVTQVRIGVFAGDLRTSTPAVVQCEYSIRCGTGAPEDPTPDQYDQIMELLGEVLDSGAGGTGGGVPIETDPTVPDWAKQPEKPSYTAAEVGAISQDQLEDAVNQALTEAKESGEFDGAPGKDGKDGQDGYTPVKGVDYFDGEDGPAGKDGAAGVGVSSVKQTTTSTEDGGSNVVTVTLTNGTTSTFTIKNGGKGDTGPTGAAGKDGADGKDGSDANVTKANVVAALGYAPIDPANISLGIASDGLIYIFVNGDPVGTGIPQGQSGDVFGYVDENNTIVLNGNLADGTYSLEYEMENGNVVDIGNMVLDSNVYYSVTSNMTNCMNGNDVSSVVHGGDYIGTVNPFAGYEVKSIVVTMGGTDISSTAVSGTLIEIQGVTGDIVITAVAEEVTAAEPVTVDIALTDGIRIGSDGTDRTQAGYCATPHIDLTAIPKPCTIHLTKALWCHAGVQTSAMVRVYAKNTAGSALVADTTRTDVGSGYFTVVDNSGIGNDVTVTVTSGEVASIRFSGGWTISGVSDSDVSFAAANTKATLTYTPAS